MIDEDAAPDSHRSLPACPGVVERSTNDRRATFLGIGAQKCASTWLHEILAQCPDVGLGDEKEMDFFSYHFDRGYEWYERRFSDGLDRKHRGEISPSYFINPNAPARAAAYNPDLHILVCLRDPVVRAFSNHLHEVRKGHVSGANLVFEAGLANNPLYINQGLYAEHLSRWYDVFPPDRILVLFQEDIKVDRPRAARSLTDSLDLPPLDDLLDLQANESVRYRNPMIGETLWSLGQKARRAGLGRTVETIKALPGVRQMRASNREALKEVIAPMEVDTEARLVDRFAQEVRSLEALIGRPVPWPRFHRT